MSIFLVVKESFYSKPVGLGWRECIHEGDSIELLGMADDAHLVFYTELGFHHHINVGGLLKVVDKKELFLAVMAL